jgi:hypothetical protein
MVKILKSSKVYLLKLVLLKMNMIGIKTVQEEVDVFDSFT